MTVKIIVMINIHYNVITVFAKPLFWKTKNLKISNFPVTAEGIT